MNMSIFGGIKNTIKKTEAELILENLLKIQFKAFYIHENPSRLAEKLVSEVWQSQPDVFDGKFGQRPFKLTAAAAALSYAIKRLDKDNPNRVALIMSLGNLFSELEVNEKLYPLNSLDHKLLEESLGVLKLEMSEILNSSPYGGVVSQFEDTVLPASKEVQKDADLVTTLLTTSSQMNKSKGESSNNEMKVDNSKTFDLSNSSSNNDTAAKQQASDSTDKKKDNPSILGINWIIYLLFLIIIFMVILGMYLLSGEEPVEVYETPLISNKSVPLTEKVPLESSGPSFDCTKVSKVVEILICNDFELSELDINLSDTYRSKKARLRGATLNVLKSQQYAWLKKRNDCKTVNCIKRAYINRIREVSNDAYESNFKSIDNLIGAKLYEHTKERFPKSCYPLPEGVEVILNEAGANTYESSVISSALANELTLAFESYLISHLKYGCNESDCRAGLDFSMPLKSFSHDLNGDGKDEVFVEFDAPGYCGMSPCQTYVIDGASNKVLFSGHPSFLSKETKNGYKVVYNAIRDYDVPISSDTSCPYKFVKWSY